MCAAAAGDVVPRPRPCTHGTATRFAPSAASSIWTECPSRFDSAGVLMAAPERELEPTPLGTGLVVDLDQVAVEVMAFEPDIRRRLLVIEQLDPGGLETSREIGDEVRRVNREAKVPAGARRWLPRLQGQLEAVFISHEYGAIVVVGKDTVEAEPSLIEGDGALDIVDTQVEVA